METVCQHSRNKIGMNGAVVWEENQKVTSSTQAQIWSIHVVVRTKTAKKCTQNIKRRAGCTMPLFLFIKAVVLCSVLVAVIVVVLSLLKLRIGSNRSIRKSSNKTRIKRYAGMSQW